MNDDARPTRTLGEAIDAAFRLWSAKWPKSRTPEQQAILAPEYARVVRGRPLDAIDQGAQRCFDRLKYWPGPEEFVAAVGAVQAEQRAALPVPPRDDDAPRADVLEADAWRSERDRMSLALLKRIERQIGHALNGDMYDEPVRRGPMPAATVDRSSGFVRIGELGGGWESTASDKTWALMRAWENVHRAYDALPLAQRAALPDRNAADWPGPSTELGRALLLDAADAVAGWLAEARQAAA